MGYAANSSRAGNGKGGSGRVTWEIIKNHEYQSNRLSEIVSLYVIKILPEDKGADTNHLTTPKTVLVRTSLSREVLSSSKLPSVEIMSGVFPYQFTTAKKSAVVYMRDLYKHLREIVGADLPWEMEEYLINEYKREAEVLKQV